MFGETKRRLMLGLGWADPGDHHNLKETSDLGSVTDPTGIVKSKPLTGLIDTYTGNWGGYTSPTGGAMAQWQHAVLLSDAADPCSRTGIGGQYASQEITLRFAFVGYADLPNQAPAYPPADALPLTFQANAFQDTTDGVHRVVKPYVMQASRQGNPGSDVAATGGTVTFTRMDAGGYEGSWDLTFNGDHTTGSFIAPWCGTPPA